MRLIHHREWLWAAFGVLVTIGLAALAVLSVTVWRLDRAEAAARQAAAVEENLRLALWRIDSAWAPLVAQESVRPVAGYASLRDSSEELETTLATADNQASVEQSELPPAGTLPPDRLAILDRFEWTPDGVVQHGGARSSELYEAVDFPSLWQRTPPGSLAMPEQLVLIPTATSDDDRMRQSRSAAEFQQRSQAVLANNALMQRVNTGNMYQESVGEPATPTLVPFWESGQMLLARRAQHRGREVLQVCSLDWERLRHWSLDLISDLLPHAALEPVEGLGANGGPAMLAALPVRLIPGSLAAPLDRPSRFSVPLTLAVAWTGVLLAGAFGGVLLYGVMQLSERRAAFVSAVTHELRTPLTTFQLYTEMLSAGMVPDEATRHSYLETLRSEALRLNHLVDNVLAYARLERGRGASPTESLTLGAVIERTEPRLEHLARRGEMRLVVEPSEAFGAVVRVNVSVVEQILLNLVDNACKYAAGAADCRILVSALRNKGHVELRVCDHGPGLPAGGPWMQPFSKTAQQAAESSPGIGLGLALSRRLARQIGGELRPDDTAPTPGACLVLRLPIAKRLE